MKKNLSQPEAHWEISNANRAVLRAARTLGLDAPHPPD